MAFTHFSGPVIGGLVTTTLSIASPVDTDVLKWITPCAGEVLHVSAHIEDGTAITCAVRNEAGDGPNVIASTTGAGGNVSGMTFDRDETISCTLSSASGSPVDLNLVITWYSTGETTNPS